MEVFVLDCESVCCIIKHHFKRFVLKTIKIIVNYDENKNKNKKWYTNRNHFILQILKKSQSFDELFESKMKKSS